ncbi:MAG TPA: M20/M25/M40 family metallo-hydrolase, partial [Armatimonadota bacterium]|nr:M20/M25/M40 family metallo-hydrolase [Armatimonadota bacterium]
AVEAIRALRESALTLGGDLVLCAHGLHEAPGGVAEDLEAALADGAIRGDAALVLELGADSLPVAQVGSAIFRARFSRAAGVTHEVFTPAGTPHPASAAAEAVQQIEALNQRLAAVSLPHLGHETAFVGQVHCGDFYNRFPNTAFIEGTRRWAPERSAADVQRELGDLLAAVARRRGLDLEYTFSKVRDGCRIAEDHPLVRTLRQAYLDETGRALPFSGSRVVADASLFHHAGIPCAYHGLAGEGAHGDVEWIPESELRRAARVYLRLAAAYLGLPA